MKNKKLFAILTLVCFMFTLMPVAAFAADAELDDTYIRDLSTESTTLTISDATTSEVYVFAVKDGVMSHKMTVKDAGTPLTAVNGVVTVTGCPASGDKDVTLEFAQGGTYTVYVVDQAGQGLNDIVTGATYDAKRTETLIAAANYNTTMKNNVVTVKVPDSAYSITFDVDGDTIFDEAASGSDLGDSKVVIAANEGFTGGNVTLKLTENTFAVRNAEVEYSTVGYVNVTPIDAKTDKDGEARFKISASKAGNFKVIVKYNGHKVELDVEVTTTGIRNVETAAEPTAPVALGTAIDGTFTGVVFKMTDANGYVIASDANIDDANDGTGNVKVAVIKKPADSVLGTAGNMVTLTADATENGYVLNALSAPVEFDAEGEYVFKVTLASGASATATVVAKEMGEPVAIKFVKAPMTVAWNDTTAFKTVVAVDANGVTEALDLSDPTEVVLSASGLAVLNFAQTADGSGNPMYSLTTKNDDKYIGSKITVLAKAGEFVATTEVTVVDQAATIKYMSNTVEVGVNSTLIGMIYDAEGKMSAVPAGSSSIVAEAIVIDKPANAIAVADVPTNTLNSKGQVELSFLASEAGEYKVQTIITYTVPGGGATKYISGIETITVGNAAGTFKDVVVVSIGADSMIVNSKVVKLDVAPYIENSRTMLQYNVLDAFGIKVTWDGENNGVIAEGNGIKVVMTIGSKVAVVNGETVTLDVAPTIVNSRTVVPVGFITGTFGINPAFTYNADGSIADIIFTAAK